MLDVRFVQYLPIDIDNPIFAFDHLATGCDYPLYEDYGFPFEENNVLVLRAMGTVESNVRDDVVALLNGWAIAELGMMKARNSAFHIADKQEKSSRPKPLKLSIGSATSRRADFEGEAAREEARCWP